MTAVESGAYQRALHFFESDGEGRTPPQFLIVENRRLIEAVDALRHGETDRYVAEVFARFSSILASALEDRYGFVGACMGSENEIYLMLRGYIGREETDRGVRQDSMALSDATKGIEAVFFPDTEPAVGAAWGYSIEPQTHHYVADTNRLIAALDRGQRKAVAAGLLSAAEEMFASN